MRWPLLYLLMTGCTLALSAQITEKGPAPPSSYSAAFYSGEPNKGGGGYGLQSLVVFPFSGPSYTIPLPFALGYFAQSADGRVVYASAFYSEIAKKLKTAGAPERNGIFRFELASMRMDLVPESGNLGVFGIALSQRQDKLLVSGWFPSGGGKTCGLFEVSLPDGGVKSVVEIPECDYLSSWIDLSLSPDGERAVASRKGSLDLIDLRARTVRSIGTRASATWSPDGQWLAVQENKGTFMMDTKTFTKQRKLWDSYGVWSPDSRYVLGGTGRGCPNGLWTLQALDVATGSKWTIDSSKCQINRATLAWVSIVRPK